jgi:hypothetical protein
VTVKRTTIRTAAALLAVLAPAVLLAQAPVAADVELAEARKIPAEHQAAAYKDPSWAPPRTSWGHRHLDGIEQFTGNGRGYWDGDTLVIESRGFTDRTSVGGGPHSENLRTTERIRRLDPDMSERAYEREVAEALAAGREPPRRPGSRCTVPRRRRPKSSISTAASETRRLGLLAARRRRGVHSG